MQGRRKEREAWQQEEDRRTGSSSSSTEVQPGQTELSRAGPGHGASSDDQMDTFGSELPSPDCRGSGEMLWGATSGVGLLSEPASGMGLDWL